MIELQQLFGLWQTVKIHWHGEKWDFYRDEDDWRQYQFEAGGAMLISYNFKGRKTKSFFAHSWEIERGKIILYELGKRHGLVRDIISDSLVIELYSGIHLYFRKLGDVNR